MRKAGIAEGCEAFDEALSVFGNGCRGDGKDGRGDREFPLELPSETQRERAPTVLEQRQVRLGHAKPCGRLLLRPAFQLTLLPKPGSIHTFASRNDITM